MKLVNDAIMKTRELARGLLPVVSDAHGLMSALRHYSNEVENLFGTLCRFQCEKQVLIHDTTVATHLYHVAQEAVTNAIRHARATSITIQLQDDERWGTLTIKDDGIGIEKRVAPHPGVGLQIMNYRPQGTIVTCHFPIVRDEKPGSAP